MRRRAKWRAEMDLFPFLSVLSCALGSLMMIAVALIGGRIVNVPERWMVSGEMECQPRLVVWDGTRVLVDNPGGYAIVPWSAAQVHSGRNDTAFGQLLDEVSGKKNELYILIAVRPSGFANFSEFIEPITSRGIRIGHWPVAQEKMVSLYVRGETASNAKKTP